MERITCADLMGYLEKEPEKVMILDIETTGFYAPADEVLSLAIIDGTGETLFYNSFKPEHNTAWPEAQAVNGISPADVADSPSFAQETEYINLLLAKAAVIVGYNHEGFDLPFLAQFGVCPREDVKLVDVMLDYAQINGEWDTKHQDWKWQKLTACAAHYNYQYHAHDSLKDAEATLFCARKCGEEQFQYRLPAETKKAIDRKIDELGEHGCRKFLEAVDPVIAWAKDYKRAVRSELSAENWPELTEVFLKWECVEKNPLVQLACFDRMFHNPQQFIFDENKELFDVMDCVPPEPMEP